MKKLLFLSVLLCLVFSCISCNQAPAYLTETWGDGVIITAVNNKIKDQEKLNIPSELSGKKVLAIAENVFANSSFQEVTLPDYLSEIENNAFANCKNLLKITFNQSLTKIGVSAFSKCVNLGSEGISFPGSLKTIDDNAFHGCKALNIREISQVQSIGSGAFNSCNLSDYPIYFNNLDYLGVNAFANSLITEVIFKQINIIDNAAFSECEQLASITVSNTNAELGNELFRNCYKLKPSGLNISETILYRPGILSSYPYLTDANIPEDTTIIPSRAYANCISLCSVTIPASVIKIENHAFTDCFNLRKITIPETVQELGQNVFSFSENLEILRIEGNPSIAEHFLIKSEHPKLTVQCKENTQIKTYCETNSIPYEIIL